MKKFNQLKQRLMESEYTEGGGFNAAYDGTTSRSVASDFGAHRIEDATQRSRINAFLQAFSQKDYLDPRSAIALLRAKLNLIGLDFQFNNNVNLIPNTVIRLPLTRFGGTFGFKTRNGVVNHGIEDSFERTDGISEFNNGKGLQLIVNIGQNGANGLFKFNIMLEETTGDSTAE